MAQLTDDCFAFSGPLLRLDDMERLIGERIKPVAETEEVPLHGARGRVLAFDVKAPVDLPPFDNSAVDGYAVCHADLMPDGRNGSRLAQALERIAGLCVDFQRFGIARLQDADTAELEFSDGDLSLIAEFLRAFDSLFIRCRCFIQTP